MEKPANRKNSTLTVHSYRQDRLYPRITKAVESIIAVKEDVSPVQVLIEMKLLTPHQVEEWRFGRISYLERVIKCNLTRLSRLLRILRFHMHDLNFKPSQTVYKSWGKGPKRILRFSKTGDHKIEEAYSRHFVSPHCK